ncbi:MAG: hypothetical protein PHW73_09030 [Atribacterota bacterium]|nr:hypothetical protein [Atribacterota bacterium]
MITPNRERGISKAAIGIVETSCHGLLALEKIGKVSTFPSL